MITVLAILSAATGAVALASSTGTLNAAPAAADQVREQSTAAGAPFRDPPDAVLADDADGGPTVTLDAYAHDIQPTIRFNPGAHVNVHLVNHLPVATDVYFHGLRADPSGHFDGDLLCISSGDTYNYRLVIPANHQQGTYWYHAHAVGATCPNGVSGPISGTDGGSMTGPTSGDVENQIHAGPSGALIGALIIGDDRTLLPPAYQHITAHTLVLNDVQIDPAGAIVPNTATAGTDSSAPTIQLVNGQLRPVLTMRPNETQLWRLINAGADIFYRLRLDGCRFTVVGEDGVPVAGATTADTLLLPPAKRYDVLVTADGTAGDSWLRTIAYSNGPGEYQYPGTALAQLTVAGDAVARLPALTGAVA